MRVLWINVSPRQKKSNTHWIFEQMRSGMKNDEHSELFLYRKSDFERAASMLSEFDWMIIGMPLYVDAMPSKFLAWLETLEERNFPPKTAFLLQSGFPESAHSRPLANYCATLPERFGSNCAGVVIRGGMEARMIMPEKMLMKLAQNFSDLGARLSENESFSESDIGSISQCEHLPLWRRVFFSFMDFTGFAHRRWKVDFKKYGTAKIHLRRPFA